MLEAATVDVGGCNCWCWRLQPYALCGVQVRLFEGPDGASLVSSHQHACCTMSTDTKHDVAGYTSSAAQAAAVCSLCVAEAGRSLGQPGACSGAERAEIG